MNKYEDKVIFSQYEINYKTDILENDTIIVTFDENKVCIYYGDKIKPKKEFVKKEK